MRNTAKPERKRGAEEVRGGKSEENCQRSHRSDFDSQALSHILSDGLAAVKQRGKAQAGDKTMVDALEPAALKAQEVTSAPLDGALPAVTEAAREGMEKTKDMVAAIGKAKTLGQRSLGHPDPGAVSTYLILKFMTEYVTQSNGEGTPASTSLS